MRKYRSLVNYLILATVLLFAPISEAVIFGDIKVYSFLDEPLNAELEMTDLNGVDPNLVIASLGSANDFVRANLARPFFLTTLTFNVVTYQDRVFVAIQSTKVVKTPYLEFLIDFEWPTGSFIKNYTVLLDPPPNNFNFATRPVPFSSLAEKQTSQKLFPSDVKRMQEEAQAKAAAAAAASAAAAPATMPQGISKPGATPIPVAPQQPTQLPPAMPADQTQLQQTPPQTIPPQKTPFQKQIDQNAGQVKQKQMLLEELIDDVKGVDAMVDTTSDLQHLSDQRQKHLEMYKDVEANVEPEIDFGDIIKPGAAQPGAPVLPGAKAPVSGAVSAAQQTSGGWMLLLAGFLLGAVVVVGIAFKKGWHKKLLSRHQAAAETIPDNLPIVQDDFEMDIDFDVEDKQHLAQVNVHEEIELTTVAKQSDDLNLDEFERELANLASEKKAALDKGPSRTMSDLLNIGNLMDPSSTVTAATKPTTIPERAQHEPEAPVQGDDDNATENNKPSVKQDNELKTEPLIETNTEILSEPEPEINFDALEIEIAKDDATKAEQAKLMDKVSDNLDLESNVPTVEPKLEPTEETVPSKSATSKSYTRVELKLEDESPPMLKKDPTFDSELKLEPEGAPLIDADEEAIKLKIELAKKYLDAGDKDTARALLHEVAATAKDSQKLEAEIILSGIL